MRNLLGRSIVVLLSVTVVIGVGGSGALGEGDPFPLTVTPYADVMRFAVEDGSVKELRLEVFSLAGHKVFDSGYRAGQALDWQMRNAQGQPVASGVYLYFVSVTDASGNLRKRSGKLVVLRGRAGLARSPGLSLPGLAEVERFLLQPQAHLAQNFASLHLTTTTDQVKPDNIAPNNGGTLFIGAQGDAGIGLDTNEIQAYGGDGQASSGTLYLQGDGGGVRVGNVVGVTLRVNCPNSCILGHLDNSITAGVVGGTIAGGGSADPFHNRVTDDYGTVGGGRNNQAGDNAGTTSDKSYATVGGGWSNTASGLRATVPGGGNNIAAGDHSFAAGNLATALHEGTFVWADSIGADFTSTASDQFLIRAGGGVGIGTNSPSNMLQVVSTATVSAFTRTAAGDGGNRNAFLLERDNAPAVNNDSVAFTFRLKRGDGTYINVAGARGVLESAAGGGAGAFAFSTKGVGDTFEVERMRVTSTGNLGLGVTNPTQPIQHSNGAFLSAGGAWTDASDRNLKGNFAPIDGRVLLEKLARLPIQSWNYKGEGSSIKHLGPVAQDFYPAFGLGVDDKHLSALDANGVALASIQALYALVQEQARRLEDLSARLARLERLVPEMPRR